MIPEVCPHCGAYALLNVARSTDSMTCTECGTQVPCNILPLFIVTGASGVGKTSLVPALRPLLPECLIFDKDLLGATSCAQQLYASWLLVAFSVAQHGRYSVICGTIMPEDLEQSGVRERFGTIHFLNLHCNDEIREQRLRARPPWRNASSDEFIEEHKRFAHWLLEHAETAFDPPLQVVDTSYDGVEEVARKVAEWVLQYPRSGSNEISAGTISLNPPLQ